MSLEHPRIYAYRLGRQYSRILMKVFHLVNFGGCELEYEDAGMRDKALDWG